MGKEISEGSDSVSKVHNARAYQALDRAVRLAETWISKRLDRIQVHSLESRLSQRIVELMLAPFIEACADRYERGQNPIPAAGERLSCAGLTIDASDGRVQIRATSFVRAMLEFLGHWFHVLLVFGYTFSSREQKAKGPAALVFGVGADELTFCGSDERFIEFCRNGPIEPLRLATRLIVQSTVPVHATDPEYVLYSRFPMHALVREQSMSWSGFLAFLRAHFCALLRFARVVAVCRVAVTLGRDFAYLPMAEWLSEKNSILSIIITSSNYSSQPLWMREYQNRKHKTNMLWYSQNTLPFVYSFDPVLEHLPVHRHIAVDDTWVWTEGFGKFLTEIGLQAKIHVTGPILFYLEKKADSPDQARKDQIRIGVFDVSPVEPSLARTIWLRYNYYNIENTRNFLRDIVSVRNEIAATTEKELRILLKHKRIYTASRDARYFQFVEELTSREAGFELVFANSDLYEMIGSCDLIVVVPWSSPVYIAQRMGIPAIYYDPSGVLLPTNEKLLGIEFVSGADALRVAMRRALGVSA